MAFEAVGATDAAQGDQDGLSAGLAGLSGLIAGTTSMEQLLTEVANFAVQAVPGADGAGVTMLKAGQQDTIVASTSFVRDVDSIQYRLGEGPCISAATTAATTGSGALGEDASWPTFGPLAANLGVQSALSLPLIVNGEVLGAINVYAHSRDAFDEDARRLGELFAGPAAVAVHNARVLQNAQQHTRRAETALTVRSTIDRAMGVLMSRTGLSEDDAYLRLRIQSQQSHTTIDRVAAQLVDEAAERARARRSKPDTVPPM